VSNETRVVPLVPTQAMLDAWCDIPKYEGNLFERYAAMLSAAPPTDDAPKLWLIESDGMYQSVFDADEAKAIQAQWAIEGHTATVTALYDHAPATPGDDPKGGEACAIMSEGKAIAPSEPDEQRECDHKWQVHTDYAGHWWECEYCNEQDFKREPPNCGDIDQ